MPTSVMKSFADKAGVPVDQVEGYWEWAKEEASKKFKKRGAPFWAYVSALTQRRLGLRETVNLSFSEFLVLVEHKYQAQPEEGSSDA